MIVSPFPSKWFKHLATLLNWQWEGILVRIQGSFLRLLALPLIYWVLEQTTASLCASSPARKMQIITALSFCPVSSYPEGKTTGKGLNRWGSAPGIRWPRQKQLVRVLLKLSSNNSWDVSYPRKHKASPELCKRQEVTGDEGEI